MFAVVEIGGNQFKVTEGETISTFKLDEKEGKSLTLDKVLMFAKGADVRIGQPFLKDVKVTAKVVEHDLDEKLTIFKYRRRKHYANRNGHRQKLSTLSITKIDAQ